MPERAVQVINANGIHARPAAEIVKTAGKFRASIAIARDDLEVNAKSIMGVMMLAAGMGSTVEIDTHGEREQEALDALLALIADKFGEGE